MLSLWRVSEYNWELNLPPAYSHRLTLPIRQRSPQPFYGAKPESPQPPHTQRNLDEKDRYGEEQPKRGSDLAEERLKEIVAQRHAPDHRQWRQPPPPSLTLRQEKDG